MSVYVGSRKVQIYHGDHHPAELWGPGEGVATTGKNLCPISGFSYWKSERFPLNMPKNVPFTVSVKGYVINPSADLRIIFKDANDRQETWWLNKKNGSAVYRNISLKDIDAVSAFFYADIDVSVYDIQIELGSVPTPYEPYTGGKPGIYHELVRYAGFDKTHVTGTGHIEIAGQSYHAALPSVIVHGAGKQDGTPTPENPIDPVFLEGVSMTDGQNTAPLPILRALPDGSVRDEIDVVSGTVTRRIKVLELSGDEKISEYTWAEKHGIVIDNVLAGNPNKANSISTHCSVMDVDTAAQTNMWVGTGNNLNMLFWIGILDALSISVSEFPGWLSRQKESGTPVTIWYELPAPIIERCDPVILRQHPGCTRLIQQGGFREAEIEAEYYKEMKV